MDDGCCKDPQVSPSFRAERRARIVDADDATFMHVQTAADYVEVHNEIRILSFLCQALDFGACSVNMGSLTVGSGVYVPLYIYECGTCTPHICVCVHADPVLN